MKELQDLVCTSQEVETDSQYPTISIQKETNYQRVLESLEYSLGQFSQHQKETLEVHKLYSSISIIRRNMLKPFFN